MSYKKNLSDMYIKICRKAEKLLEKYFPVERIYISHNESLLYN